MPSVLPNGKWNGIKSKDKLAKSQKSKEEQGVNNLFLFLHYLDYSMKTVGVLVIILLFGR